MNNPWSGCFEQHQGSTCAATRSARPENAPNSAEKAALAEPRKPPLRQSHSSAGGGDQTGQGAQAGRDQRHGRQLKIEEQSMARMEMGTSYLNATGQVRTAWI